MNNDHMLADEASLTTTNLDFFYKFEILKNWSIKKSAVQKGEFQTALTAKQNAFKKENF